MEVQAHTCMHTSTEDAEPTHFLVPLAQIDVT